MGKRQSDTGQSQGTSPGRMSYRSHGKSPSLVATWLLPLQRETHRVGGRRWHNRQWGSQGQDSGVLPKPCLVFSL